MKTLAEFRSFYESTLIKDIEPLEKSRRRIASFLKILACILGGIALILMIIPPFGIAFASFGGTLWILAYLLIPIFYRIKFKALIIPKIIGFVAEGFSYDAKKSISEETLTKSNLFQHYERTRYNGSDLITGRIGETKIEFSEMRISCGKQTEFCGLFLTANFNKNFKGRFYVMKDVAERLLGHIGTAIQAKRHDRGELIKLENPEFEKLFVVYGTDQVEGRYILSTSLIQRILDFTKKNKEGLEISFIGSKIYIAVYHWNLPFHAKLFKPLLEFSTFQSYYEDLALILGIVDDLHLNTRIWN